MSDQLTLVLNTKIRAASQYVGYPFDSVVEFNGAAVFFGTSGIYEEGGGLLGTDDIPAWIDLPLHDFGRREQKTIEAVDLGYEAEGELIITLTPDQKDTLARDVYLSPIKSGQVQQDSMLTLRKIANGKARYWGIRVANVLGCDFSLDYIALAPVVLKRRSM